LIAGGDAAANKVDESVVSPPSKPTSESTATVVNGVKEPPASDESAVVVVPPDDAILHEFELIMNEEVPFRYVLPKRWALILVLCSNLPYPVVLYATVLKMRTQRFGLDPTRLPSSY
jgi:hypothetical protein